MCVIYSVFGRGVPWTFLLAVASTAFIKYPPRPCAFSAVVFEVGLDVRDYRAEIVVHLYCADCFG